MTNPVSTYRLQFHAGFTFSDFEKVISYLHRLGIKTIYASPVFWAVPGSAHGYDALNPHRLNPEIGTMDQWQRLSNCLKQNGMSWLQDIVPNHMAFDTRNPWLMDVLEKGRHSPYASFFDLGWNSDAYEGKPMVPFLGNTLEESIEKGVLQVAYKEPRFVLHYFEAAYPLGLSSYRQLLQADGRGSEALQQLLPQIEQAHMTDAVPAFSERFGEIQVQLTSLMKNDEVRSYVHSAINAINADKVRLQQLAEAQVYRLCHWRETDHRINYRRFFTVNGLICLNIHSQEVFEHFHRFIKSLADQKIIDGLRVDHIDGLYDPTQYLQRLKKLVGPGTYIVVEKILHQQETLPDEWETEGSTGYDFLSMANNLLTHKGSENLFTQFYRDLVRSDMPVSQQIREKKADILYHHMNGELENLHHVFMSSSLAEDDVLNAVPPDVIRKTIGAFLICCPVYRFYGNAFPLRGEEEMQVGSLLETIQHTYPQLAKGVELLKTVFLQNPHRRDSEYNRKVSHFYQRCMQFSGPLMAKGVEDTLMYTYNRFITHNEVGDSPDAFGMTIDDFHQRMTERSERCPLSINTTSTHDTKRGEDMRARLQVLSDRPQEWISKVKEWMQLNGSSRKDGVPDVNEEYFIYQSLTGAYPMPGEREDNFLSRFTAYLQKALREAKIHSSWSDPDLEYEKALTAFAAQLLNRKTAFWKSFSAFHYRVSDFGILNSLTQLLLKFACPGVPDTYQGTELWDLSLVDPDNRRPVDYAKRFQWLEEMERVENEKQLFQQLWRERFSGKIKLWLTHRLLRERNTEPDLFSHGEYIPLPAEGVYKENILGFARRLKDMAYVIAVPLHTAGLLEEEQKTVFELDWKDTRITIPFAVLNAKDVFAQEVITGVKAIPVKDLFKDFPFALWKCEVAAQKRGAGTLVHITSLPSPFGIGDVGPAARSFADFLYRTNQKYWQLLPLSPVAQGQGYSPYSSTSSMAGNTLLISPELLEGEGWLDGKTADSFRQPNNGKVDYAKAEAVKRQLLGTAWEKFLLSANDGQQKAFKDFCQAETEWLDDYSLYMVLKQLHGNSPWYEWPPAYKDREEKALEKITRSHSVEMEKIKWGQFVFFEQWEALKNYCNSKDIQLIGDLPFYVSYDSADVWAHRRIFKLDEQGHRLAMAGVPPDAFSEDGQLWGMPVFNWEILKDQHYRWWVKRLQKNTALFDLVRLDHFRAFSSFWEVPASETTARNGRWQKGPGSHFFETVQKALGRLPFIAEDLGDIDEEVYKLRDQFGFPGMNVLQFAFGDTVAYSNHSPHNYIRNAIVYTGTHDNNTTLGWYKQEREHHQRHLKNYIGRIVREDEVSSLFCRLAYASVADIAIIPIQDVLGLDETARMNTPSSAVNNWQWRLLPDQMTADPEKKLRLWTKIYNRV